MWWSLFLVIKFAISWFCFAFTASSVWWPFFQWGLLLVLLRFRCVVVVVLVCPVHFVFSFALVASSVWWLLFLLGLLLISLCFRCVVGAVAIYPVGLVAVFVLL